MNVGLRGLAAVLCVIGPAPVLAQVPASVPGENSSLLGWGIAAGLAVIVLVTGFLNPKRSHLT